jgi:hypothetical protein
LRCIKTIVNQGLGINGDRDGLQSKGTSRGNKLDFKVIWKIKEIFKTTMDVKDKIWVAKNQGNEGLKETRAVSWRLPEKGWHWLVHPSQYWLVIERIVTNSIRELVSVLFLNRPQPICWKNPNYVCFVLFLKANLIF